MKNRWKLLDGFCKAGGAGVGYHRAGFNVVGVDIEPQRNYPFDFVQADFFEFVTEYGREFDAIHASPPCQAYTKLRVIHKKNHPDLVAATRSALEATGKPWIIENVECAPIRPDFVLCGSHFGLKVRRHRLFETSWGGFSLLPPCDHRGLLSYEHKGERAYADAMECPWMTNREGRQAIPPAYTEYIGTQLLLHMESGK